MNPRPDVVLLDYGSGNVRSAQRALEWAGADVRLTDNRQLASHAAGLVVPGVGAFAACMTALRAVGAREIIESRMAHGRPVLGICVGMQVLFDRGVEHDVVTDGLGLLPGVVERLQAPILPHIGWNTVVVPKSTQLFAGIDTERFYFVHSYAARSWPPSSSNDRGRSDVTWSEHGERFVAAVESGALTATQFHPEKSGDAGLALLRNWLATL